MLWSEDEGNKNQRNKSEVSFLFLAAGKNTLDLKTTAKGLVEEKPGLELRDKRKPGEYCDWHENDNSHYILIPSS